MEAALFFLPKLIQSYQIAPEHDVFIDSNVLLLRCRATSDDIGDHVMLELSLSLSLSSEALVSCVGLTITLSFHD